MSNLTLTPSIMDTYTRFPITLTYGEGSYVYDSEGVKYLDYTAGIATCNLGHRPPSVQHAVEEQLNSLWHVSNLYHIEPQEQLAKLLTENTVFDQVFFGNSGAEANEGAIKLARRYQQKIKGNNRFEIVTFKQSFHGRTLATLKATGQEKIQDGFTPHMPGFRYLPYNNYAALDDLIHDDTAAVMLELTQGEGGVIPADKQWIDQLVKRCQESGVLVIVDEIQTGVGRTGTLYLYEQYGFEPDILTSAKGLASGFPIGALLAKKDVAQAFSKGTHGSTFGGNPIVTTAGYATVKEILKPGFLAEVKEKSTQFIAELQQIKSASSHIKDIRAKGFLIGLELDEPAIDYVNRAREEMATLFVLAGPNVLRILPPINTSEEELNKALCVLRDLFNQ
ncbi:acetylornithine aminotransferase [Halolactibacillus alkaliphilus]|uniref:Acetylornithine aminotransferase n=1 Tax=Halolactibacillus alkaliphilus TaxID=442899 RepID=A0A511WXV2_9BACI|nr:aspartate aminotransferase family protein [Halolactibacillus alkaliphilus]GEN55940.1 acetylornithine aminotransferase [Halolactibacillus alkaliphilus]GGN65506.1 acetylornithine aminotransferase [Halolactibacillus alkaliphilus]SFO65672.1 acetylornithine aminotransferase [Halolactibacillus alkaliphilus]